jgi:hypothetical protein
VPPRPHKQVPAKVTAYVDEGMKELVELLNTFDMLSTFSSCQGGDTYYAHIYLFYGNISELYTDEYVKKMLAYTAKLVKYFYKYATREIDSLGYNTTIAIQWEGNEEHPFISIDFPSDYIEEITKVFSSLKNGLQYDTLCK